MKTKELVNLLNRAAAALETPQDLNPFEIEDLTRDLTITAREIEESYELVQP